MEIGDEARHAMSLQITIRVDNSLSAVLNALYVLTAAIERCGVELSAREREIVICGVTTLRTLMRVSYGDD